MLLPGQQRLIESYVETIHAPHVLALTLQKNRCPKNRIGLLAARLWVGQSGLLRLQALWRTRARLIKFHTTLAYQSEQIGRNRLTQMNRNVQFTVSTPFALGLFASQRASRAELDLLRVFLWFREDHTLHSASNL